MKAQFLYEGRKPDVTELEAVFGGLLQPTYKRLTGKVRVSLDPRHKINTLDWPWFRSRFDAGYRIRCIILKDGTLKANGVKGHNGFYSLDTDGVHDFYVTDIQGTYAKAKKNGFRTALAYMVAHELMHGVVWEKTGSQLRAVSDVHKWVDEGTLKIHFNTHFNLWLSDMTQKDIPQNETSSGILTSIKARLQALMAKTELPLLHPIQTVPIRVTQKYGVANSLYKLTGRHIGTDYGVPAGTPLHAPADGVVTLAGEHSALGYFLHFQYTHKGQRYTERWCHLSELPKKGSFKQGQVIALSGNTGLSTGPHLHREKWYNDVQIGSITKDNWDELTLDPEA